MGDDLKLNHKLRIGILKEKQNFAQLDQYLEKLSVKGVDVAAVPFQVINEVLSSGTDVDFEAIIPLARHTPGGQPRLLNALLADLGDTTQDGLRHIVADDTAHPMTRFEAMGWAVYLAHCAVVPMAGAPAGDVFQYWDQPNPPREIEAGRKQWNRAAKSHVWYGDAAAHDFIVEHFGTNAAFEYSNLSHPALKSDVFRLYRLAKLGGVYTDADSMPGFGIPHFLEVAGDRVWASCMTNVPNCATINGFIAAPASDPLIEALLEHVLRNVRDVTGRGVFWLSGPGAFTEFLYHRDGPDDAIGLLPQGVLKSELFSQFDAPYKYTNQNWRVFEHTLGLGNEKGLKRALR